MKEEDIKHLELVYSLFNSYHYPESEQKEAIVKFKSIIDSLKPAMKETKRYRIKLPETITTDDIVEMGNNHVNISWLFAHNGEDVTEQESRKIIGSYLVEISPDKPVTAEELLSKRRKSGKSMICERCYHEGFREGFHAAEKIEEFGHRTPRFEDWYYTPESVAFQKSDESLPVKFAKLWKIAQGYE